VILYFSETPLDLEPPHIVYFSETLFTVYKEIYLYDYMLPPVVTYSRTNGSDV
jgi:hypothetical protein